MNKLLTSFLVVLIFASSCATEVQAQVQTAELYGKVWRVTSAEIIKPDRTVPLFYRNDRTKGKINYRSTTVSFHKDGKANGTNAAGWRYETQWKLMPNNQIFSEGDEQPGTITKLTSTELIIETAQPYTTLLSGETYNITHKVVYEAFDPCDVFETLRSGNWDDPTIWTCQKVPTSDNKVRINPDHKIQVRPELHASMKSLENLGSLEVKSGGKLLEGK